MSDGQFIDEIAIGEQLLIDNLEVANSYLGKAMHSQDMGIIFEALSVIEKSGNALTHFSNARLAGPQAESEREIAFSLANECIAHLEMLAAFHWAREQQPN